MRLLRSHGRFEYAPIYARGAANGKTWPNGARLAVYIGLNLEHFDFGDGLGGQLVPGANTARSADVLNYSWREYGNRVGAVRLLEALDRYSLPCSVLFNGAIVDHAPEIYEAHVARGDEIVGHGWTNSEKQGDMDEATEKAMIADVTAKLEGRPTGWLGPWISQSHVTPDLLEEAGYSYLLDWCHDDCPVAMTTRSGGSILAVPYPQELNDIPTIMVRRASAADFAAMIVDNLREMLEEQCAKDGPPLVMGIALHPYIVGQPFRLRHLRAAFAEIEKVAKEGGIWLTTAGAIADAWTDLAGDDATSAGAGRAKKVAYYGARRAVPTALATTSSEAPSSGPPTDTPPPDAA